MSRAALVIGLGGTGQRVLTWLKKDLLEFNDGVLPTGVRLLAFDTTVQVEEGQSVAGGDYKGAQQDYEGEVVRIGQVSLEKDTEFIHLGGNCYDLGQKIAGGEFPHLDWFDAKIFIDDIRLPKEQWVLDRGAGRYRQFGLLAVYKDLLEGPMTSKILLKLPSAVDAVRKAAGGQSFEVIFISSLAGGTGSAMLVPLAVLVQEMARRQSINVRMRAIIVLPSAFSPGEMSEDLQVRGGAALRELARAMIPPKGYKQQLNFGPGSLYESVSYERPFDGVYFIDGTRGDGLIPGGTKYGVFPAAAGWIRQILDEGEGAGKPGSGSWFTTYLDTNRFAAAGLNTERMTEGVFGVFGIKSFYTPARTWKQTYRLQMAEHLVQYIADPVQGETPGTLRANPQPEGAPLPSERAHSILEQDIKYGSEQQVITSFLNTVSSIVRAGGESNPDSVSERAGAWKLTQDKQRRQAGWEGIFMELPQDPDFADLRGRIDLEQQDNFQARFKPSDQLGRSPGEEKARLDLIDTMKAYLHEHYGTRGAGRPPDWGQFGRLATEVVEKQIVIFRNALRLRLLSILSEAGGLGKGRLGHAMRVLEESKSILNQFLKYLAAVERERGAMASRATVEQQEQVARVNWEKHRRDQPTFGERFKAFLGGKHPYAQTALRSERGLLNATISLVYYYRELVQHGAAQAAAEQMIKIIEQTIVELRRWEGALLRGARAERIEGLLEVAQTDLRRVGAQVEEDKRSSAVEELIQVQTRQAALVDADRTWAVSGLRWEAEPDDSGSLAFKFSVQPTGVETEQRVVLQARPGAAGDRLNRLERVMERNFGQNVAITDVLEWCRTNHEDVSKFAAELLQGSDPLAKMGTGAQAGGEAISVSVQWGKDVSGYHTGLENALRLLVRSTTEPNANHPIDVLSSADPYRLTCVRTRVGYLLREFAAWQSSETYYQGLLNNQNQVQPLSPDKIKGGTDEPRLPKNQEFVRKLRIHYTQPEEKAAIALEVARREEQAVHRVLNPRLVWLLRHPARLHLALEAWALDWIVKEEDTSIFTDDRFHWTLRVPGWSFDFWITPNQKVNETDDFKALEALLLKGINHNPKYTGTPLQWNHLGAALRQQRQAQAKDQPSPLKQKVQAACGEAGFVTQWRKNSGESKDERGIDRWDDPAYRDLTEYAERYFGNLV